MIVENYFRIRNEITKRAQSPVEIVGVTKKQPIERVRALVDAGLTILGNNYVQEGRALWPMFPNVEWHFIGHIQSRKVKELTDYHVIESLARIEVARKLNDELERLNKSDLRVLVEINIGDEKQKSGIKSEELPKFLTDLKEFPRLLPQGLMCLPPPLEPQNRRPFFRQMKQLGESHGLPILSMGTSEDFLIAVEEGANRVRLGTALFGTRL